jgi:hypothetical protein
MGEIDLDKGLWTIATSRRKNTRRRRASVDLVVPCLIRRGRYCVSSIPAVGLWWFPRQARCPANQLAAMVGSARKAARVRYVAALIAKDVCDLGGRPSPPRVVSALLGHRAIGRQLLSGYNRSRYSREVEAALQQVADYADALEVGRQNVVTFEQPA